MTTLISTQRELELYSRGLMEDHFLQSPSGILPLEQAHYFQKKKRNKAEMKTFQLIRLTNSLTHIAKTCYHG